MAHVSHKLKGALQGALAGGGDPATSPLYVFGPFLALIVGAGVAPITMGASIWMVVLTVCCRRLTRDRVQVGMTLQIIAVGHLQRFPRNPLLVLIQPPTTAEALELARSAKSRIIAHIGVRALVQRCRAGYSYVWR